MKRKNNQTAGYITALMDRTKLPRNQIAAVSGLSNPYIRELERGNIANVGREKLIALAVALNLTLVETDELLTVFDRASLSVEDIPLFLDTGGQRRLSAALHPLFDLFVYELMISSIERIPGRQVIVNDRPTACLRPAGHRSHNDRHLVAAHPVYGPLVEAIGRERQRILTVNLADHVLEHYICRSCLLDYLRPDHAPEERAWRVNHLETLTFYVNQFPNFELYLTTVCPSFNFTLKQPPPESGEPDKLFFIGKSQHGGLPGGGRLAGFGTDNPVVTQNFKEELKFITAAVIDDFRDRSRLLAYLRELIAA